MRRTLALLTLTAIALLLALRPAGAQGEFRLFLPALENTPDLRLRAGYLGATADDEARAVDFGQGGAVLVAGRFPGLAPAGVPTSNLLGGGDGAVIQLDLTAQRIVGITRLGPAILDMETDAGGAAVVCGEFGVAVLAADLRSLRWSDNPGPVSRCTVGAQGSVAALSGGTVHRYQPDGGGRLSFGVGGTAVADIALDESSGLVFATGYSQKGDNLKVAWLRAYDGAGGLRWASYDHSASAILGESLGADSEGRRVTIGRDGKLYFAGWTDGGNSIYQRDPRDVGRRLGAGELIKFDPYNDPYRISGAKSLAWYGRFAPATGALERGQWLLTRLNDGSGNSIGIRAIDAAEDGTLLLAGEAYASLEGRSGMQFGGVTLGGYEGGEPFLLVVSPDLAQRRLWTALAAPGTSAGGSGLNGAAIRGGFLAVAGSLGQRSSGTPRGLFSTADAPQPALAGGDEGYLLVMPAP